MLIKKQIGYSRLIRMMTKVYLEYEKKYEAMIKDKILELFKNTTARIFLFGSRARGDYKRESDFDIGVESVDYRTFRKLILKFDEYWEESIIPYKVDFVFFETVNADFAREAKKERIIWKVG